MKPANLKSGRCRPLSLALLALAFLLQAWIPPGYMLAPARAGVSVLVICPGSAVSHHEGDHKKSAPSSVPCPFAALAQPAVPPAPPIHAAELPAPVPAAMSGPDRLVLPLPFVAPHPPARGPPATR